MTTPGGYLIMVGRTISTWLAGRGPDELLFPRPISPHVDPVIAASP